MLLVPNLQHRPEQRLGTQLSLECINDLLTQVLVDLVYLWIGETAFCRPVGYAKGQAFPVCPYLGATILIE